MTKCTELFTNFDVYLQYLYCLCELKIHIMTTKPIISRTCIEFIQVTIIRHFEYLTLFIIDTHAILIKKHERCLLKEYVLQIHEVSHKKLTTVVIN